MIENIQHQEQPDWPRENQASLAKTPENPVPSETPAAEQRQMAEPSAAALDMTTTAETDLPAPSLEAAAPAGIASAGSTGSGTETANSRPRKRSRNPRRRRSSGRGSAERSEQTAVPRQDPMTVDRASAETASESETEPNLPPPAESSNENPFRLQSAQPRINSNLRLLKFPGLEVETAKRQVKQFIQQEMEAAGASKALVGISGGLDSTLAAYLTVNALGPDQVELVFCQTVGQNAPERGRAEMVARWLKCPFSVKMVKRQREGSQTESGLVPRECLLGLYEAAEASGAQLIGTRNKTKWWLSAGPRHGDMTHDLNPLADFYRSQVLEMARAVNLPRTVIDRALQNSIPAGRPGSFRDVELMWKEIDFYLYQIVDEKIALAQLYRLGAPEEKILWIYRKIKETAWQRRPARQASAAGCYSLRTCGF